jgi:hypothetical protein
VAVCAVFVGFESVPVILAAPLPVAPPVSPPVTTGSPQLYVVPTGTIFPPTPSVGVTEKAVPLQVEVVCAATNGFGLTVTVTVNVAPVQLAVEGVTVYVAVWAVLVGFVSVPVMLAPLPAAPPVRPPVTTGIPQLYVVPAGIIFPPTPFTGVTVKAVPLHVVGVCEDTNGFGFTVIVTVKFAPVQLPDNGVTV